MSNKPKLKGAKTLLQLEANEDYAHLEVNDATRTLELLYALMRSEMSQGTVCIVMAVEMLRNTEPEIYQQYIDHIYSSMMRGSGMESQN